MIIEESDKHKTSEGKSFFVPQIDTWGLNMRRGPKKKGDNGQRITHWYNTNLNRVTYHTNSGDNSPNDKCCPMGIELQPNAKRENHA